MRNTLLLLLLAFTPAFAQTKGQFTISVSTTPTAVNCTTTDRYVTTVTFRVIPGGGEKIYIGSSAMSITTLSNIAAILYPNGGAHSEQFSLTSRQADGVDLCGLYTAGTYAGDKVLVDFTGNNATYSSPPSPLLTLIQAGPIDATHTIDTSSFISYARAQVIPGMTGKVKVSYDTSGSGGLSAELYPNSGTLSQHNAWSEVWDWHVEGSTNKPLDPSKLALTPEVVGESVLFSSWGPVSTGIADATTSKTVSVGTTAVQLFSTSGSLGTLRIRVVPGFGSKVAIGYMNGTTFETLKVLYPNATGGWSEEFSIHSRGGWDVTKIYAKSLGSTVNIYVEEVPLSAASSHALVGGTFTWATAHAKVSLNVGENLHSLKVSVVPGGTGKVYLGTSTMNTSTLAGVFAILYPNSTGRWSEEFNLEDTVGNLGGGPDEDGIDPSAIYVTGDAAGESVNVTGYASGNLSSTLSLLMSGPLNVTGSSYPLLISSTSLPISNLRIQTLPGQAGKMHIGNAAMVGVAQVDSAYKDHFKVLWPNTGSYNVGEGFTETYTSDCSPNGLTKNCLNLNQFSFWPEVSGESILVSAWGH